MLAETQELRWRRKFPRLVKGDKNTAFQSADNCFVYIVLIANTFLQAKSLVTLWAVQVEMSDTKYMWWEDLNRTGQTTVHLMDAFLPPKIINLLSFFSVTLRYTDLCPHNTNFLQNACSLLPQLIPTKTALLLCYCCPVILEGSRYVCTAWGHFPSVNQIFVQSWDF